MRKYESVVVFANSLGDAQIGQEVAKFGDFLKGQGAVNLAVDSWGKREIAYSPLGKKQIVDYRCFKYESDNHDIVDSLISQLRITEGIVKFQTHKINERVRKFKGNPRYSGSGEVDESDELDEVSDDLSDDSDDN